MAKYSEDTQPTPPTVPPLPTGGGTAVKAGLLAVALVAIAGVAWYLGGSDMVSGGKVLGVTSSYQAVFLTNGQVYFGKLATEGDWVVLRDIYYLQVTKQLQPAPEQSDAAAQTPNIQLVKLGSELHGPEDEMYLEKDKVLFWENMKEDSKVNEAIKKHKESQE